MGHKPPKISFEFFPPKSLQASFDLWESLNVLAPLNPEFVSVTYGAGGTTRQLTKEMTEAIGKSYGLDVAAHLTCDVYVYKFKNFFCFDCFCRLLCRSLRPHARKR